MSKITAPGVNRNSDSDMVERPTVGELKQRLMTVSNKKLIRLANALHLMAEKYGGKDQLVEAVCQARGKSRDTDYKAKLASYSVPRLLDMARAS